MVKIGNVFGMKWTDERNELYEENREKMEVLDVARNTQSGNITKMMKYAKKFLKSRIKEKRGLERLD